MNGSDWKSDKHPVTRIQELEAKLKDAELLIEKLVSAGDVLLQSIQRDDFLLAYHPLIQAIATCKERK